MKSAEILFLENWFNSWTKSARTTMVSTSYLLFVKSAPALVLSWWYNTAGPVPQTSLQRLAVWNRMQPSSPILLSIFVSPIKMCNGWCSQSLHGSRGTNAGYTSLRSFCTLLAMTSVGGYLLRLEKQLIGNADAILCRRDLEHLP